MSREFSVPFRTRSSSHTAQCRCSEPDNTYTFSSPSKESRDSFFSPPMTSKESPRLADYFHPISEIKSDDERSSNSSSSENDRTAKSSPTNQETEIPSRNSTAAESGSSTNHRQDAPTPNYARLVAYGLMGMTVDYNGDILDASGKSCGKASGDITEMVGQKIDEDGLIRSTAGEVVGQVTQNYGLEEAVNAMMEAQKRTMGDSGSRKNNRTFTEERQSHEKADTREKSQELPNIWQGTVGEAEPGNDIHLNVQSTKEGISMSIRIPTLFMKEQHRQFEEESRAKEPEPT